MNTKEKGNGSNKIIQKKRMKNKLQNKNTKRRKKNKREKGEVIRCANVE